MHGTALGLSLCSWKIYESVGDGAAIGRQTLGRELATIHDYRQRLGQYRLDLDLQAAHQHAPWITVWWVSPRQTI